jgi:hypothetical protein
MTSGSDDALVASLIAENGRLKAMMRVVDDVSKEKEEEKSAKIAADAAENGRLEALMRVVYEVSKEKEEENIARIAAEAANSEANKKLDKAQKELSKFKSRWEKLNKMLIEEQRSHDSTELARMMAVNKCRLLAMANEKASAKLAEAEARAEKLTNEKGAGDAAKEEASADAHVETLSDENAAADAADEDEQAEDRTAGSKRGHEDEETSSDRSTRLRNG